MRKQAVCHPERLVLAKGKCSSCYHRDHRAAHRSTENARHYRWRAKGNNDRPYVAKAPVEPMPALHQGHTLFEQAVAIVGPKRGSLKTLYDPLWDDCIAAVTLALLQGNDPREALRDERRFHQSWGYRTTGYGLVAEDGEQLVPVAMSNDIYGYYSREEVAA